MDETIDGTDGAGVLVYSSGKCQYFPFGLYSSECSMDIRGFPFDQQRCPIEFVSWSYDMENLNLSLMLDHVDLSYFRTDKEWELVGKWLRLNVL